DDFMLFGAGFGDEDVDLVPVKEKVVDYAQKKVVDANILIPASSIKGALAHRVAYYYNKLCGPFAEKASKDEINAWAENNEAVVTLFGSADPDNMKRGNVLFEDIIEVDTNVKEKIFNHVSIDRFTGGAIDGALFSEKATYGKGKSFKTTITLLKTGFGEKVLEAFESALKDIVNGLLPLGGATNKGYGCFSGKILKNGEELK
ncbi:MAG: CRISPR-associated protein, partial [Bacteroidaceae bacterium]|nr:CRISPR-associated protein [Bacteroidaceae bacterium]